MHTYCKLVRDDYTTRGGMKWPIGTENRATGEGETLCSDGVLHAYDTPEQAAFMQPAHVPGYTRMLVVESEDEGITDGTKCGVKSCTPIREIPIPEMTVEQRVEIAIRCAKTVCKNSMWNAWADKWLSGEDRSRKSADAAASVYSDAASDDVDAASDAAAAAYYAYSDAAYYAYSAYSDAAAYSAYAASAAATRGVLDLVAIINQVLEQSKRG